MLALHLAAFQQCQGHSVCLTWTACVQLIENSPGSPTDISDSKPGDRASEKHSTASYIPTTWVSTCKKTCAFQTSDSHHHQKADVPETKPCGKAQCTTEWSQWVGQHCTEVPTAHHQPDCLLSEQAQIMFFIMGATRPVISFSQRAKQRPDGALSSA